MMFWYVFLSGKFVSFSFFMKKQLHSKVGSFYFYFLLCLYLTSIWILVFEGDYVWGCSSEFDFCKLIGCRLLAGFLVEFNCFFGVMIASNQHMFVEIQYRYSILSWNSMWGFYFKWELLVVFPLEFKLQGFCFGWLMEKYVKR